MRSSGKTARPVARLIGRHGAVEALLAAPGPVTWITAPAGSGKTSLGLELCAAIGPHVAWLRLDEADTDAANFLLYFERAIGTAELAPQWAPPKLLREHLPSPQGYLRLFVRSLAAAWGISGPACIVMDDAQSCQEAPFFRFLLEALAAEMPPSVRVIVLSRAGAPSACARLLAHGEMGIADSAVLPFSRAETEVLLNVLGVAHADAVADTVYRFTRGWPAGVALVAAWLRRRPQATPGFDDVLSGPVIDYLAEEVFAAFASEEQATLLAVCWLPFFSGAWAVTLSGWPQAADFVARMAAQGALIYEYPGRQYALHPLLQGFLRKWAETHLSRQQRCATIGACIELLHAAENDETAIELALEHGLPERAAGLILASAEAMFVSARHVTLAKWIDALPPAQRGAWHEYWLGLAVFMSDTARARTALLRAFPAFGTQSEGRHRFLALSAIISSYFFSGAAEQPLRTFLRQHIDADAEYEALPDPALKAHLTHSVWSAMFMTDPGHPDMGLWERRALEALRQPADPTLKVRLASMLAQHYFQTGRYASLRSVRALMEALPGAEAPGAYGRYLSFLLNLYTDVASLDAARIDATYAAARASSEETGIRIMDAHYALIYASACMLRGEPRKAAAIVADVAAQTPPQHHNLVGHLQLTRSWLASWNGDGHAALEHARLAHVAAHSFGSVPYEVYAAIAAALARSLFDRRECARDVVALRDLAQTYDSPLALVHADLLDAWLALTDATGAVPDPARLRSMLPAPALARADARLERALRAIVAEGSAYLTFAAPHILAPLCARALAAGTAVDAAQALIRAYRLAAPADAAETWPRPLSLRVFGTFELLLDGAPLPSQGKSKHRQLDVLKLVAAHAPASVSLDRAAELLWPDTDGDGARHALETTLSRLRATIGAGSIVLKGGMLSLGAEVCWCDAVALEGALPALLTLTHGSPAPLHNGYHSDVGNAQGDANGWHGAGASEQRAAAGPWPRGDGFDHEAVLAAAMRVMALYRGELLAGDSAPWLLARREVWRGKVVRALGGAGQALAEAGHAGAAVRLLEHALDADPGSKALTARLIALHLAGARYEEGLAVYRRYQRIAHTMLGTPVGAEIEALAQQLLAGAHAVPVHASRGARERPR